MTALKITQFGGQVPRVSPRALPADAAQRYENLLATSTELRPLAGDKTVAAAAPGARTLYRLGRDAEGALRGGDTDGWLTDAADKNHVKGQLNDDATERTVVSWNDGSAAPRVIDAKGADRLLGVPAPASVAVTANITDEFTRDEALAWVDETLIPALADKLLAALVEARVADNKPVAGSYSLFGKAVRPDKPWLVEWGLDIEAARQQKLDGPELGGRASGATWLVPFQLVPYWGRVTDKTALENALRLIENPSTGQQAFTDPQLATLATGLAKLFDPDGPSIKARREELDKLGRDFDSVLGSTTPPPSSRPVEPTRPTRPSGPEWEAYLEAYAQWQSDLADWEREGGAAADQDSSRAAKVQELQARAVTVSNEIEAEYFRRRDEIAEIVGAFIRGQSLISGEDGDGLIKVAPDRIIDTRFYIATYVTDWGWESAPSAVSEMLEVDQNDSVTITVPAPPPDRHITHWRLYRSNVGSASAAFQFVDEMLITTPSYHDELKGEQLGEPCPTLTWAEPPVRLDNASPATIKPPKGPDPYLKGAVGMPNGIVAGFIDNFVAFCHPYHPYAWPVEYQVTTEFPIVGLGVFGQTLFVGTMGNPYLISGADSASMSALKLDSEHSCVSRRSIVGVGNGVVYASPDGLCLASQGGVQLLTGDLFSREDWQALNPASIVAAVHEGVYYFWTAAGCWALDFVGKKLGTVTGVDATALHRDMLTDHLYAVVGNEVRKLFSQGRRDATWRSGVAQLPAQAPLAWVQVDSRFEAGPVTVRWTGDGALRHTATFHDTTPQRLPPGRWLEHEVEIETASRVTKIMLAGSTAELKSA